MYDIKRMMQDEFEKKVPSLFLEQINLACKKAAVHLGEFRHSAFLLQWARRSMPMDYRAKCGVRISNNDIGLCEITCDEGIIENISLYLERQLGELLYTTLGAAYRSSLLNLRHMLQIACWATQAIFNKKSLTQVDGDNKKSMDLAEFREFLERNLDRIGGGNTAMSTLGGKKKTRTAQGIMLFDIPEKLLSFIDYDNRIGREAVKALYSDLSSYAHANSWEMVELGGEGETFFPTHTNQSFHDCMHLILKTMEVTLCLLLIAGFEELSFYSKARAHDFVLEFSSGFNSVERPKFQNVSCLLDYLKGASPIEEIEEDRVRIENETKKLEELEIVCQECAQPLYGDEIECPFCQTKIPRE